MTPRFVSYLRVSTQKQGRSGLGVEAQREAVTSYLNGGSWELIGEYVEAETGKGSNALDRRPQLRVALEQARKAKATLIIAKLDRLSRNARFLLELLDQSRTVPLVFCDLPSIPPGATGRFILTNMAAVAELEAGLASERTKAALAAAKARGVALGTNGTVLAAQNRAAALAALEPAKAALSDLVAAGLSIRAMVERLNADRVPGPSGGRWHPSNLHKALRRLDLRPA